MIFAVIFLTEKNIMGKYILKKGYDIKIKGAPSQSLSELENSSKYALTVDDFIGIKPKLCVKVGDVVKMGSHLFHDKKNEKIKFCSPTSGVVSEICRGERRALQEIVIDADGKHEARTFEQIDTNDLLNTPRETILNEILDAGLFPFFIQRPYAVIANPDIIPKNIFISAYNTAPLSPKVNLLVKGNEAIFQAGINALSRLTEGSVHLSIAAHGEVDEALEKVQNAEISYFGGSHPAGNVGIQAHHISPVNKGEAIWTVSLQGVITIGKLFLEGIHSNERIVSIAGEGVTTPQHYKINAGVSLDILNDKLTQNRDKLRIIDGDVLSGKYKKEGSYFGFYNNTISIIPEIEKKVFMGWMLPDFNKESFSRTMLSWLMPKKKFSHNTGYHGGVRAFVASEQYESVFPMDIYPVHLIKSVMYDDVEEMESLGILEVAPEDFALCDYVCVSKIETQYLLRQVLDRFHKEA